MTCLMPSSPLTAVATTLMCGCDSSIRDSVTRLYAESSMTSARMGREVATRRVVYWLGNLHDVLRLQSLRPLDEIELHAVALHQRLPPLTGDRRVMDERVGASVTLDHPVALFVVEPLHGTPLCHTSSH